MIKTPVVVKTEEDFDGRPIALLVQEASQYASTIYIQVGEKHINAKKYYGYDESESCRWGRDHCCDRWRRRAASG